MRRLIVLLCALVLVAAVAGLGTAAAKKKQGFQAMLSGKAEVPSVKTNASGEAWFHPGKKETEINYTLRVKNIENATAAHIHAGAKGVNGPPLVNLFTGPKKEGKFSGELAKGTITAADLHGSLEGKKISDLIKMMRDEELYVNVHTDQNPDGEIRGEIEHSMKAKRMKKKMQ
jgi:hypothetical protein